jgi:transcription initiation factor TFIID TATA-box-binding protein
MNDELACVEDDFPIPTIQNVVATFDIGDVKIPLDKVVMMIPFADYNAKRFAAVIMKIRNPYATCLLFSSGKVVCTGAKSETLCRSASSRLVAMLRRYGVKAEYSKFKIENIVAAVFCPFFIDLRLLQSILHGDCSYDSSIFPGLIYRILTPNKIAILCFSTGKCNISGAKNREQSFEIWRDFYNTYAIKAASSHDTRNDVQIIDRVALPMKEVVEDIHVSYANNADAFLDVVPTLSRDVFSALQSIAARLSSHVIKQADLAEHTQGSYLPIDPVLHTNVQS